ncbi:hypothetical protein G6F57_022922 [Rhizopus arrhizus]|nr:hypothetical protein G6F57_022922 [Rhizopus arrhizus]
MMMRQQRLHAERVRLGAVGAGSGGQRRQRGLGDDAGGKEGQAQHGGGRPQRQRVLAGAGGGRAGEQTHGYRLDRAGGASGA